MIVFNYVQMGKEMENFKNKAVKNISFYILIKFEKLNLLCFMYLRTMCEKTNSVTT